MIGRDTSIVILLMLVFSPIATSETASPESIRKLMERTGAANLGLQVMSQMIAGLKQMAPEAPQSFWDEFMAEAEADDMTEMIIPIYQKYLTEEDIEAMNIFNSSPTGQKLIRVQPLIAQESMIVGEQWGHDLTLRVWMKSQSQFQELP